MHVSENILMDNKENNKDGNKKDKKGTREASGGSEAFREVNFGKKKKEKRIMKKLISTLERCT